LLQFKTDDDFQDELKSIVVCMQFREIEEASSVMFKKRKVEETKECILSSRLSSMRKQLKLSRLCLIAKLPRSMQISDWTS
jgi:ribosomal protein S14